MSSLLQSNSKNDKEYLIAVKTEYKLLEKKYLKAVDKFKKWETRAKLAKEKNKSNLQAEAEGQAEIIRNNIKHLTDQLVGLKIEVKNAVKRIRETPQQLSIDPRKLLTEMENLIGDGSTMELENDINEIKVDNELEKLKREMGNGGNMDNK